MTDARPLLSCDSAAQRHVCLPCGARWVAADHGCIRLSVALPASPVRCLTRIEPLATDRGCTSPPQSWRRTLRLRCARCSCYPHVLPRGLGPFPRIRLRLCAMVRIEVRTGCSQYPFLAPQHLVDIRVFVDARKVEEALARHDCSEALAWCAENRSKLRKIQVSPPARSCVCWAWPRARPLVYAHSVGFF